MSKSTVLIVLLVVVLAGVATISRVASDRAKQVHAEAIVLLEASPHVTVLADAFEPGWTHSRAEIHVEVAGPMGEWVRTQLEAAGVEHARTRVGLRLDSTLEHGPTLIEKWWNEDREGELSDRCSAGAVPLDFGIDQGIGQGGGQSSPERFCVRVVDREHDGMGGSKPTLLHVVVKE